jgi:hypothetical protein
MRAPSGIEFQTNFPDHPFGIGNRFRFFQLDEQSLQLDQFKFQFALGSAIGVAVKRFSIVLGHGGFLWESQKKRTYPDQEK